MTVIHVLDHQTIDKIAAGEVVERPSSVVKELVENSIDAGADAVTVEIREGGTTLIRVTDNGSGIGKDQIANAFLRHATSKITSADDLTDLVSLGFRGEALASIAAVSAVEVISKTPQELTGVRYVIEGGIEKEVEEIGAPDGTTVLVRNLFYNTPPRRKFLKQPQTEGSYVAELVEHLAMSNPGIAFKFVSNGQTRFYTSGSNDLSEIIYRIYGREIARELIPVAYQSGDVTIDGMLGKPVLNRANRSYEIFYINGRYVKSSLIGKAVEEGCREYLMQHKFPFCVLHFRMDTQKLDVNVHPSKMEVRIADAPAFYEIVRNAVSETLHRTEMIPEVVLTGERSARPAAAVKESVPEPFEKTRAESARIERTRAAQPEPGQSPAPQSGPKKEQAAQFEATEGPAAGFEPAEGPAAQFDRLREEPAYFTGQAVQTELFETKVLSEQARKRYEIIGQLFETYWLISYEDKLLIIDQHAAHEKVKYERFLKRFRGHETLSQAIDPPIIVTMNPREQECYGKYVRDFEALGFVLEEFGGNDYAIRGVPTDLYGYGEKELFLEVLDELADDPSAGTPESIRIRIAEMACKAAVKGNMRLSRQEAEKLIDELLTLENPYHCPHGRPTIVSMTKYELEKKFKRIVT